jgi:hypothetical protein
MIETMDSSALTETRKYLAKSSAHAAVDIIKGGNSSKAKKTLQITVDYTYNCAMVIPIQQHVSEMEKPFPS